MRISTLMLRPGYLSGTRTPCSLAAVCPMNTWLILSSFSLTASIAASTAESGGADTLAESLALVELLMLCAAATRQHGLPRHCCCIFD